MKKIELWEVKNLDDIKTKWGYLVNPSKIHNLTKTTCFGVKSKYSYKQIIEMIKKSDGDANSLMIKLLNTGEASFVEPSFANNIENANFYPKGKCKFFWSIDEESFSLPREHKFSKYYFYKDKAKFKFLDSLDCNIIELEFDETKSVKINNNCDAFQISENTFLLKYHLLEAEMGRIVNSKQLEQFLKNEEVETSRKEVFTSLTN